MIRIDIHEANSHLSRWIQLVEGGETVIFCRHNVPVAEIRALPAIEPCPRPIGRMRGEFRVDETFFEPLPSDVLDDFDGRGS